MTAPNPAKSAPERVVLAGRFVRLEPLELRHAEGIYAVSTMPGGPERYRWLFSEAPKSVADVQERIKAHNAGDRKSVV